MFGGPHLCNLKKGQGLLSFLRIEEKKFDPNATIGFSLSKETPVDSSIWGYSETGAGSLALRFR